MTLHPAINRSYIAKRLGISRSFLHQIEHGQRPIPKDKQTKLDEILAEIQAYRQHLHK